MTESFGGPERPPVSMQEIAASGLERAGGATVIPVDRNDLVAESFEAHHAELYRFLRRGTRS